VQQTQFQNAYITASSSVGTTGVGFLERRKKMRPNVGTFPRPLPVCQTSPDTDTPLRAVGRVFFASDDTAGGPSLSEEKVSSDTRDSRICEHKKERSRCKDCGGSRICQHQRERRRCRECGGSAICEHKRERSRCRDCGGRAICQHQRVRSKCNECVTRNKQQKLFAADVAAASSDAVAHTLPDGE